MCTDCHAQRLPSGEFDRNNWLLGGALPFRPTVDMPWAEVALPIAGLHGYTDEQAVKFLMTGERPSGIPVRPPMPVYRMTRDEAEAVVAYLRSVSPAK